MNRSIHILNSSALDAVVFHPIAQIVGKVFRSPVDVVHHRFDFSGAYDESRSQYNSGLILAQLPRNIGADGEKIIAVVDVDLFVPVLTFVFGEAQFKGAAAVVSFQRLGNSFYGLPEDGHLLHRRLAKEIVHELGHTFGLYHCRHFECVMRSSTYVEEIDLKSTEPCPKCRALIDWHAS